MFPLDEALGVWWLQRKIRWEKKSLEYKLGRVFECLAEKHYRRFLSKEGEVSRTVLLEDPTVAYTR